MEALAPPRADRNGIAQHKSGETACTSRLTFFVGILCPAGRQGRAELQTNPGPGSFRP